MAIENIHSKCLEIDKSIKLAKTTKKNEGRPEGEAANLGGDKGSFKPPSTSATTNQILQKTNGVSSVLTKPYRLGEATAEEGRTRGRGLPEKTNNSRRGRSTAGRGTKEVADGREVGEDGDMLSLALANEKLKYVLNSLMDFREILRRERQHKS